MTPQLSHIQIECPYYMGMATYWLYMFLLLFLKLIYPIPSWTDGLGFGGTADGFREGGRCMYPDSDNERCRMAGGRDPRELKRRTATSFSEK